MPKKLSFSLSALALAGVTSLVAQQPEATFEERLEVTEVLLDVMVTDSSGNIIIGLGPADFVIKDGDRDIPAATATFYSNRRFVQSGIPTERLGISPEEIPSDRYFILFFHDQRYADPSLTSAILDAVRWTKDWVRYETLANDWVAVLSYDSKLKVHQDFTNHRESLLQGLESVAKGGDPGSTWPSRIADQEGPSLRAHLPQGRNLRKETVRVYSALTAVAEAAGFIVGRKNVMFFSVGFGNLSDTGTYLPDERYYPPMMEALNDNNVAVYAISWIKNVAQESGAQSVLNNSLSLLASDTGGRYYFNFVNFRDPLIEITEDNNGYYLISYDAEYLQGERGFREVEVSTSNPDFEVRARRGYRFGL